MGQRPLVAQAVPFASASGGRHGLGLEIGTGIAGKAEIAAQIDGVILSNRRSVVGVVRLPAWRRQTSAIVQGFGGLGMTQCVRATETSNCPAGLEWHSGVTGGIRLQMPIESNLGIFIEGGMLWPFSSTVRDDLRDWHVNAGMTIRRAR